MMTPHIQAIASDVCVAGQLDPSAMAWAAQNGFKSVINNRPDFEGGPEQPSSTEMQAAALAAGLQYAHLPVSPSLHSEQEIARMAQLLAELPRPVLLYCRSGARSARLYQSATSL